MKLRQGKGKEEGGRERQHDLIGRKLQSLRRVEGMNSRSETKGVSKTALEKEGSETKTTTYNP